MKKFSLKITSILMAVVLLLTFVPSVAQNWPSEDDFLKDFTEINADGVFNKDVVTLYKNPVQDPSATLQLARSTNMPKSFTVLFKFVDADGNEWYMLDTENWNHTGWDTAKSGYGYASVSDVSLVGTKSDTCGVYEIDDKLTISDTVESVTLYNDGYFESSAATNSVNLKRTELPSVLTVTDVKTVLDGDCKTTYYYKLNGENWPSDYTGYHWLKGDGLKLAPEGNNFTAYLLPDSGSDISLYIRVPAGAFDGDFYPTASDVENDGVYRTAIEEALKESDPKYSLFDTFSRNISFIGKDGTKLTPKEKISVTAFFKNGVLYLNGMTEKLRFYHMNENADGTVTAEKVSETGRYSASAVFESSDFSVYTLAAVGEPAVNNDNVADPGSVQSSGLTVSKKVSTPDADGVYNLTLEAYATGSQITTAVSKDQPTDIVLVLDQSGSMSSDGNNLDKYSAVYTLNKNQTYYVQYTDSDGKTAYKEVKYCSSCQGWYNGGAHSGLGSNWGHNGGIQYLPKTSETDSDSAHVQFYNKGKISYQNALKEAVTDFVKSVNESAKGADGEYDTDDDVNHRIAMVTYARKDTSGTNYGDPYYNTGFLIGNKTESDKYYQYNAGKSDSEYENNSNRYQNAAQQNYGKAFLKMDTEQGYSAIIAAKDSLSAGGGTFPQYGIEMANGIFEWSKKNETDETKDYVYANRKRIVIFFTDGQPGWSTDDGFSTTDANAALTQIVETKDEYKATVYSVGIFSGANGKVKTDEDKTTAEMDCGTRDNKNNFLHYMSSNYLPTEKTVTSGFGPSANTDTIKTQSMTESDNQKNFPKDENGKYTGESYYLSAGDADTLNNIFTQISGSVTSGGSHSKLTAEAVLRDVISPYFELANGADTNKITVETAVYKGTDPTKSESWQAAEKLENAGIEIKTDSDGRQTVEVKGFNYSEKWVGTETENGETKYRGEKLIVTIPIKVRDGFLGGNEVPTNGTKDGDTVSGIYENAEATERIEKFDPPKTDVEIKDITITAPDKNIYLNGTLTAEQLKNGVEIKCGDEDITNGTATDGLEAWQYDFVDIKVTKPSEAQNGLKEDSSYKVEATVSSKTEGNVTNQKGSATGNIYVFKPELTFKDSTVYYGDTAPTGYTDNKDGNTVWKHGDTVAEKDKMIGDEPALNLTCTPESDKIEDGKINTKEDIKVGVKVAINGTDVTQYTTFKHTDCKDENASADEKYTFGKDCAFLFHVKTCTLKITKELGKDTTADENELFIFKINKGGKLYTTVTVEAGKTVEIKELPVGEYTVEEDTGWSWRYEDTKFDKSKVELSSKNPNGEVKCTNTKTIKEWLNGFAQAIANIFGAKDTSSTVTSN